MAIKLPGGFQGLLDWALSPHRAHRAQAQGDTPAANVTWAQKGPQGPQRRGQPPERLWGIFGPFGAPRAPLAKGHFWALWGPKGPIRELWGLQAHYGPTWGPNNAPTAPHGAKMYPKGHQCPQNPPYLSLLWGPCGPFVGPIVRCNPFPLYAVSRVYAANTADDAFCFKNCSRAQLQCALLHTSAFQRMLPA